MSVFEGLLIIGLVCVLAVWIVRLQNQLKSTENLNPNEGVLVVISDAAEEFHVLIEALAKEQGKIVAVSEERSAMLINEADDGGGRIYIHVRPDEIKEDGSYPSGFCNWISYNSSITEQQINILNILTGKGF